MVPADALAAARAAATASLDLAGITLQRPSRTPNQWSGYSETLTTIASGLAGGWAKPSAALMRQYAGVIGSLKSWVVRLPYGTAVKRNDLLVMPSGDTLRIQADLSESSYPTCVRVLATEVV